MCYILSVGGKMGIYIATWQTLIFVITIGGEGRRRSHPKKRKARLPAGPTPYLESLGHHSVRATGRPNRSVS